ncbi:MAG TPA: DUF2934 domain-containing protein [Gaiellaceae bacterium]|nr:DUF2934 domain-containing protein [Gaiellaceae bacterium]
MPRKTTEPAANGAEKPAKPAAKAATNGTEKAAKTAAKAAKVAGPKAAKTPVRRTTRKKAAAAEPSHEHVATRAYFIHLESGGAPLENWLQAERELTVR